MNGPADRSVRLLLVLTGALATAEAVRLGIDSASPHRPLTDLKIRINVDSADRLRLMPGIGPVIADRVVAQRFAGPFSDSADFADRVRGIGPAFIADNGPWLDFDTCDAPSGSNQFRIETDPSFQADDP